MVFGEDTRAEQKARREANQRQRRQFELRSTIGITLGVLAIGAVQIWSGGSLNDGYGMSLYVWFVLTPLVVWWAFYGWRAWRRRRAVDSP